MAAERTLDPDVEVVAREGDGPTALVRYRRVSDGSTWAVRGACNRCGLCVLGAVGDWYVWDGPPGTPGASRDLRVPGRADDPVTPGFFADMQEMAALTPGSTVSGCSMALAEA